MKRVWNISNEQLLNYLNQGLSTSEIGKIVGFSYSTVAKYVRTAELQQYYQKKNNPLHLEAIDSKEMAYTIGFIIADGHVTKNEQVLICQSLENEDVMKILATTLQANYYKYEKLDKVKKIYPHFSVARTIKGIHKFIGKGNKADRNVPIIRRDLEVYMIRGIFDADGCITWGRRKDRNRIWQKVSFTSQYNILLPIQKILEKIDIASSIKPKGHDNCYVLEFANKRNVLKFYDYLYADTDFVPMKRKFNKFNALRLELGEVRENIE